MRSASGGWVSSQGNRWSPTPLPKNMWLACSAFGLAMREPAPRPPILRRASGERERIAGVLRGGGVGEELALARHRALDQSREEHADVADDEQREAEEEHGSRSALLAAARRRAAAVAAQDPVADQTDDQDAVEDAHQAHVEPAVAVEQVAHLVPHHALQLVAIEQIERAARDADHRVVEGEAGGERVDAVLVLEHVDASGPRCRRRAPSPRPR